MKRIIGNIVKVILKRNEGSGQEDIFGILVDISDDTVCVQSTNNQGLYMVPRQNVLYYMTDSIPTIERAVLQSKPPEKQEQDVGEKNRLYVYVNKKLFTVIGVPPEVSVSEWNTGIVGLLASDPDLQLTLKGKVQREIEYFPGEVYITVDEKTPEPVCASGSNSFAVCSSSPATAILSPSEMITRLNNVVSKNVKK